MAPCCTHLKIDEDYSRHFLWGSKTIGYQLIINNNWMRFCEIRNNEGRGLAETLIILDITKTEFNYCFIIHCFMENMQKLLYEM